MTFLPKPSVIVILADSSSLPLAVAIVDSAGARLFASSEVVNLSEHPELTTRRAMSSPIRITLLNLILENNFMLLSSIRIVEKYYLKLTKLS
jgi:hypothetical protein